VAALLSVLPALAQASPPDQTWIGGLYDHADYDEVVLFVTSLVGATEATMPRESGPDPSVIAALSQIDEMLFRRLARSADAIRAPPVT
jgi:hypothetical protein